MSTPSTPAGIDPRGPRFGAALTLVLLIVVLLLGTTPAAYAVLAVVVASFALGAFGGVGRTWQAWVFKKVVRPRLAPPTELEDPRPPTFAQLVGLIITGAGLRARARRGQRGGPGRRGARAGRGVPQRGVRPVPRLRAVPAGPAGARGDGTA